MYNKYLLHQINKYSGFIKRKGGGAVLPKNSRFFIYKTTKLVEGKGTVSHKHTPLEQGGTLIHRHKHSTRETMEHKKHKSIKPIKFNF